MIIRKFRKEDTKAVVLLVWKTFRRFNSGEFFRKSAVREYAAPFYQKIGYKKTTGIRNFRGLKVYPMKKALK